MFYISDIKYNGLDRRIKRVEIKEGKPGQSKSLYKGVLYLMCLQEFKHVLVEVFDDSDMSKEWWVLYDMMMLQLRTGVHIEGYDVGFKDGRPANVERLKRGFLFTDMWDLFVQRGIAEASKECLASTARMRLTGLKCNAAGELLEFNQALVRDGVFTVPEGVTRVPMKTVVNILHNLDIHSISLPGTYDMDSSWHIVFGDRVLAFDKAETLYINKPKVVLGLDQLAVLRKNIKVEGIAKIKKWDGLLTKIREKRGRIKISGLRVVVPEGDLFIEDNVKMLRVNFWECRVDIVNK